MEDLVKSQFVFLRFRKNTCQTCEIKHCIFTDVVLTFAYILYVRPHSQQSGWLSRENMKRKEKYFVKIEKKGEGVDENTQGTEKMYRRLKKIFGR